LSHIENRLEKLEGAGDKTVWIAMPDYAGDFARAVPEGHVGLWRGHLVGKRGGAFVWLIAAAPKLPPEAECIAAVEAALAEALARPTPVAGTRVNPVALGDTEDEVQRTRQVREARKRDRAGERGRAHDED